jgi:hypothetical protein
MLDNNKPLPGLPPSPTPSSTNRFPEEQDTLPYPSRDMLERKRAPVSEDAERQETTAPSAIQEPNIERRLSEESVDLVIHLHELNPPALVQSRGLDEFGIQMQDLSPPSRPGESSRRNSSGWGSLDTTAYDPYWPSQPRQRLAARQRREAFGRFRWDRKFWTVIGAVFFGVLVTLIVSVVIGISRDLSSGKMQSSQKN